MRLVADHRFPHRTITWCSRETFRSIRLHFRYIESISVLLSPCSFVYLGNNFNLKCVTRSTFFPFYRCDSIYFNRSCIGLLYHLLCFLSVASQGCLSVTFRPTVTYILSTMLFLRLDRFVIWLKLYSMHRMPVFCSFRCSLRLIFRSSFTVFRKQKTRIVRSRFRTSLESVSFLLHFQFFLPQFLFFLVFIPVFYPWRFWPISFTLVSLS